MFAAEIISVSFVPSTNVPAPPVNPGLPELLQPTCVSAVKLLPFIVSVNAELPAVAVFGERELMLGCFGCVFEELPPPQPAIAHAPSATITGNIGSPLPPVPLHPRLPSTHRSFLSLLLWLPNPTIAPSSAGLRAPASGTLAVQSREASGKERQTTASLATFRGYPSPAHFSCVFALRAWVSDPHPPLASAKDLHYLSV